MASMLGSELDAGYVEAEGQALGDRSAFSIFSARPVGLEWLGEELGERRPLAAIAAGSGCVLAALRGGELSRWYPIECESAQIDFGKEACDVSKVFLEPKGFHALVTSSAGDTWYLNFQSNQARSLQRLRGHVVAAVSWDAESTASCSGNLVLGTAGGQLLHLVVEGSKERSVRPLFVFEVAEATTPVTGVHRERTAAASDGAARDIVFATAACGIYAFVGPSLDTLFQRYQGKGAAARALVYEVPIDSPRGVLQVDAACVGPSSSKVLFWMTGVGVLAASIQYPIRDDQSVLESPPGLIPFPPPRKPSIFPGSLLETLLPPPPPVPLSMAVTRYHIIFVYEDRWVAVSRVTHEVVQQEEWLTKQHGSLRFVAADPHGEQLWMCSERSLFELVPEREDRDVWSLLLKLERFDDAFFACKTPSQRGRALAAHANWLFQKGRMVESARKFAEVDDMPFEHAALRFSGPERKAALLEYLHCRLASCSSDEKVIRALLSVWAVELSLANLNDLYASIPQSTEPASVAVRQQAREGLRELLRNCAGLEVHPTIYHLLQSYGWHEEFILFAEARPDLTTVVLHYVLRRDFAGAIQKLGELPAAGECEDLVSRFSSVLFAAEPTAFVSMLLRPQMRDISPLSVLPAISASPRASAAHRKEAVRYLEHVARTHPVASGTAAAESLPLSSGSLLLGGCLLREVSEDSTGDTARAVRGPWNSGRAIYNALVVLYAAEVDNGDCERSGDSKSVAGAEESFLIFLASQEHNPLLDLHFALRVCSERPGLARAKVQLYGYMGQHEEAVDAALEHGELALAKHTASRPADERLRQKLWLRIVEKQASGDDALVVVQTIAAMLGESQDLSVRDVLPYLSDLVTVDHFQAEISECLDKYRDQVLTLRQEMDDHRHALQAFKEDLRQAEEREVVVHREQPCEVCGAAAAEERFYAFPCRHCFHEACIRALAVPALEEERRQRLFDLEARRIAHQAAGAALGATVPSPPLAAELEAVEEELDGILADDCPLCGHLMLQAVCRPFVDANEAAEAASWAVA